MVHGLSTRRFVKSSKMVLAQSSGWRERSNRWRNRLPRLQRPRWTTNSGREVVRIKKRVAHVRGAREHRGTLKCGHMMTPDVAGSSSHILKMLSILFLLCAGTVFTSGATSKIIIMTRINEHLSSLTHNGPPSVQNLGPESAGAGEPLWIKEKRRRSRPGAATHDALRRYGAYRISLLPSPPKKYIKNSEQDQRKSCMI